MTYHCVACVAFWNTQQCILFHSLHHNFLYEFLIKFKLVFSPFKTIHIQVFWHCTSTQIADNPIHVIWRFFVCVIICHAFFFLLFFYWLILWAILHWCFLLQLAPFPHLLTIPEFFRHAFHANPDPEKVSRIKFIYFEILTTESFDYIY